MEILKYISSKGWNNVNLPFDLDDLSKLTFTKMSIDYHKKNNANK